jgi:hypothetical protein
MKAFPMIKPIPMIASGFLAAFLSQIVCPTVPAYACGGLFCSTQPVVQTKERIVFEVDGAKVRAWIQLQFQGSDPSFAWIIPVPSVPEIEASADSTVFDTLDRQTRPVFISPGSSAPVAAYEGAPSAAASCAGGGLSYEDHPTPPSITAKIVPVPKVDVWSTVNAGPYDAVTLTAASAKDLELWLNVNGYRVTLQSSSIVQTYLDEGFKLIAVRLHPGLGATSLPPIKLTYTNSEGCANIPIRLTAISSTPDLEVLAWAFAPARVVARNYTALTIDETQLTSASMYVPLMQSTVQAAGGHGFVTEYSQPTSMIDPSGSADLEDLIAKHGWITRVRTIMGPSDMTLDPELRAATGTIAARPVSNQVYLGGRPKMALGTGAMLVLLGLAVQIQRRRR